MAFHPEKVVKSLPGGAVLNQWQSTCSIAARNNLWRNTWVQLSRLFTGVICSNNQNICTGHPQQLYMYFYCFSSLEIKLNNKWNAWKLIFSPPVMDLLHRAYYCRFLILRKHFSPRFKGFASNREIINSRLIMNLQYLV